MNVPWFALARFYGWLLQSTQYRGRIRGMGFLLRRAGQDRVIEVEGIQIYFNHVVGGCYDALIGRGRFGDAETHSFLASVLGSPRVPGGISFVDVGANIGEISLDVARHGKVAAVIAIEPNAECAGALARSAVLNGLEGKIAIRQVALNALGGHARFHLDTRSPNASHLADSGEPGIDVPASTLDTEAANLAGSVIVKIDVEGAELQVLEGSRRFLERCRPLVIFEYNAGSRRRFSLADFRSLLGDDYTVWRLRGDGLLDQNLEATWNCLAAHRETIFGDVYRSLAVA